MQFNIKANFLCEVDPRQTTKRTTFFQVQFSTMTLGQYLVTKDNSCF